MVVYASNREMISDRQEAGQLESTLGYTVWGESTGKSASPRDQERYLEVSMFCHSHSIAGFTLTDTLILKINKRKRTQENTLDANSMTIRKIGTTLLRENATS